MILVALSFYAPTSKHYFWLTWISFTLLKLWKWKCSISTLVYFEYSWTHVIHL